MKIKLSAAIAGLGLAFGTFASPAAERREHSLEDIHCRCLTFRTNERPAPCDLMDPKGFNWGSARTLASQYGVRLQFAYKSTIDKVLSIPAPLPNDVLQAVSGGDASSEVNVSLNKVICGFGNEVEQMSRQQDSEGERHYVAQVIAWLMLFTILYSAGEYVWTR